MGSSHMTAGTANITVCDVERCYPRSGQEHECLQQHLVPGAPTVHTQGGGQGCLVDQGEVFRDIMEPGEYILCKGNQSRPTHRYWCGNTSASPFPCLQWPKTRPCKASVRGAHTSTF